MYAILCNGIIVTFRVEGKHTFLLKCVFETFSYAIELQVRYIIYNIYIYEELVFKLKNK